ncbi:hypothetical protein ZIOFF_073890 [Zingiber officinale]|uniref:Pentatricopeptide repeat-containing protein n=2 Tax=Zingiber officinale TaxID=94328 RepID=A0A8J5EPM4_ZINOF|nr:hypothetical protein ZIOFF_073890 [Zingiber officinale]
MRNLLPFASHLVWISPSILNNLLRLQIHAAHPPPSPFPICASVLRAHIHTLLSTSTAPGAPAAASNSDIHAANPPSGKSCTSGGVRDARCMFDEMPQRDSSIAGFCRMRSSGLRPDQFTYRHAVSACATSLNLGLAEQLYALVIKDGFCSDGYVCSRLIDIFSAHGRLDDALGVLWQGAARNVVCWNMIITGAVRNGEIYLALDLFRLMVDFCNPNPFTLSSILCACASSGKLEAGEAAHGWAIKNDAVADVFVATAIVDMYVKCGVMDAAMRQFSSIAIRNVVTWTAVISGFVQKGEFVDALLLFKQMLSSGVEINKFTLTSVLLACSKSSTAMETDQVHCLIMKKGLHVDFEVKDALLRTYGKFGYITYVNRVFEETGTVQSASTWSALVCSLAENKCLMRSMQLFCWMFSEGLKPDKNCCSCILSIVDHVDFGRQIHSYAIKFGGVHDILLGNALFTMYSKCGSLEESYQFFMTIKEKDRISFTSMISGFVGYGHTDEAFQLFRDMMEEKVIPDNMTISSILMACHGEYSLTKGKELHGYALRNGFLVDPPLGSALVSMYLQCKRPALAKQVFDGVSPKDQIMWSSLVSGFASNGYSEEALMELPCLVSAGFEVDQYACSSLLRVCTNLWRPSIGEQLHALSIKRNTISCILVSSALLTLYAKIGRIDDSCRIFNETEDPDVVMWTSIVDAYARHGNGIQALEMFRLMKENGVRPDLVTFVSVLSACSRNGLVEEGFRLFNSMSSDYGIRPESHHFACMVDLLGRSGRLKEAASFISMMPFKPDLLVWSTLLGGCKLHGDIQLGNLAAKKILELEPQDSATLVSLSNISAELGDWEHVTMIRSPMKGTRLKKEPGWSVT